MFACHYSSNMKSRSDLLLAVTCCAVALWYLADGVDSSNSYIATSRGTFLYPPIGRLFEADFPRNEPQNKSTGGPRGTSRANNRNIGDDFLKTVSHHRSKSPYVSGKVSRGSQKTGGEVDAPKTIGKSDAIKYEPIREGAIRGSVKYNISCKRTKRESNAPVAAESTVAEPLAERRAENRAGDEATTLNRDRTRKFTFQKKVEHFFSDDSSNSSSMTEEEIEKSKLLRKKLLNYYVKSKQKISTLTPSLSQLKQVVPQEPKPEEYSPRLVRMSIDIPIDHEDNIEDLFEIDQDDRSTGSKTDAQGRSRRRRLRRIAIPLLLALKLKVLLLAPILFGIVSVVALKGLWAGMTALGLVSVLALKSLFNSPTKIMYELRPPHHYHHPPMAVSEIQYHHDYPEYWNRRDSYKPIGGWR